MTTASAGHRRPLDTLSTRIRLIRAELGDSQREFSARTGVPFGVLQGMEDGGRETRNRDVQVKRIALATGYDREWLMWGGALAPEPDPDGQPSGLDDSGLGSFTRRYHRSSRSGNVVVIPASVAA